MRSAHTAWCGRLADGHKLEWRQLYRLQKQVRAWRRQAVRNPARLWRCCPLDRRRQCTSLDFHRRPSRRFLNRQPASAWAVMSERVPETHSPALLFVRRPRACAISRDTPRRPATTPRSQPGRPRIAAAGPTALHRRSRASQTRANTPPTGWLRRAAAHFTASAWR